MYLIMCPRAADDGCQKHKGSVIVVAMRDLASVTLGW